MNSPNLPNSFYLIFSGTGFTGETILQIQGGSFMVPFNPMLKSGGQWQAKVVMGNMEYPMRRLQSRAGHIIDAEFPLFISF